MQGILRVYLHQPIVVNENASVRAL